MCRAVWSVLFASAVAAVATLVIGRLITLVVEHPKTVDVEIAYEDALVFPTVTVCNQNQWR